MSDKIDWPNIKLIARQPWDKDGEFSLVNTKTGENLIKDLFVKHIKFEMGPIAPLTIHMEVYVDEIEIEGSAEVTKRKVERS